MWIKKSGKKISKRNERAITDRQKRMVKKINENLWITKNISSTTTRKNYHAKLLAGIFLNNFDNLKNGDCFYNKLSPSSYKAEDMLIPVAGMEYDVELWDKATLVLHGISAELVWSDSVEIMYPRFKRGKDTHKYEIININDYFAKEIVKNYLIKNNIISDDYFQVLRIIVQNFHIYYIEEIGKIWMEPRDSTQLKEHIDYEELLLKEIEQWYVNHNIWDKREKYKDWYTHILRNNLEMDLQQWQVRLLYDWKSWNFVIWARQIGKTFTSAFIAYREFWRSDKWYAGRDRLTLYLSPTTEKQYAPKRYFEQMIAKDVAAGLIRAVSSRGLYVNKITWAELKFISAEAKGWADSFFADSCIVDEWPMVPNEYWLNLLAILVQQKTNVFAIGTIDENSVKNWFYENSIKGELWDDKIQTIRVTIDDNELIEDDARESMKKEYKPYPMLYWCKLYATFPSSGNVFNLRGVIQQIDDSVRQDTAIIGYDPAKNSDNPWLVVMDPHTFKTTQEHSLKWLDYREQYEYIKALKKTFNKAIVIMDRRWVWEAVFEIMEDAIDFSVYYTTTKKTKFDTSTWRWSVQKKELVETLALYMSMYWLTINMKLTNLIKELKWFKKIIVWKSILYEWVGITDDSVNALMLCVFYLSSIVKTSEPIIKKAKSLGIDYEYEAWYTVTYKDKTKTHTNNTSNRMQQFWY